MKKLIAALGIACIGAGFLLGLSGCDDGPSGEVSKESSLTIVYREFDTPQGKIPCLVSKGSLSAVPGLSCDWSR